VLKVVVRLRNYGNWRVLTSHERLTTNDLLLTTYILAAGKTPRVLRGRAHESACSSRALRNTRRAKLRVLHGPKRIRGSRAKLKAKRRNNLLPKFQNTPREKPINPERQKVLPTSRFANRAKPPSRQVAEFVRTPPTMPFAPKSNDSRDTNYLRLTPYT
jgi:hypothetical protein